jgi:hypothetical protein
MNTAPENTSDVSLNRYAISSQLCSIFRSIQPNQLGTLCLFPCQAHRRTAAHQSRCTPMTTRAWNRGPKASAAAQDPKTATLNRSQLRPRRRAAAAGWRCSIRRRGQSPSPNTGRDVAAILNPFTEMTHAGNPLIDGRPVASSTSGGGQNGYQEAGSSAALGKCGVKPKSNTVSKVPRRPSDAR